MSRDQRDYLDFARASLGSEKIEYSARTTSGTEERSSTKDARL